MASSSGSARSSPRSAASPSPSRSPAASASSASGASSATGASSDSESEPSDSQGRPAGSSAFRASSRKSPAGASSAEEQQAAEGSSTDSSSSSRRSRRSKLPGAASAAGCSSKLRVAASAAGSSGREHWEMCCRPKSSLTSAVQAAGLIGRRFTLETGHDLSKSRTKKSLVAEVRKKRPLKAWLSVPCTAWSCAQNGNKKSKKQRRMLKRKRAESRSLLKKALAILGEIVKTQPLKLISNGRRTLATPRHAGALHVAARAVLGSALRPGCAAGVC